MFAAGGALELIAGYFYRRWLVFGLVTGLLLVGMALGAAAVHTLPAGQHAELSVYLEAFLDSFRQEFPEMDRFELLQRGVLESTLKTTGLMWFLGLTVLGAPLVLGLAVMRGFIIGFTIGFMVDAMVFPGLVLAAAAVLPHTMLVIPAVIIGGGASLSFALTAIKALTGDTREHVYHQLAGATLLALFSCFVLGLAGVVEVYLTPVCIQLTEALWLK